MAWIYLDDGFLEHPKMIAAGGDAVLLWVGALGYANRTGSGGIIPKGVIGRLTDRKNPDKLAAKLCEVRLWHDQGDHYAIHDYGEWNRSAIERSERARKAATTRWDRERDKVSTNGIDPAKADAQPDAQALRTHMPEQCESTATGGVWGMGLSGEARKEQPPPLAAVPDPPAEDPFDRFWDAYPRRVGKPAARKAWARVPAAERDAVLAGVDRWSAAWSAAGTPAQFVPHPATWLNDARWKDTPSVGGRRPLPAAAPPAAVNGMSPALYEYRRKHGLEA